MTKQELESLKGEYILEKENDWNNRINKFHDGLQKFVEVELFKPLYKKIEKAYFNNKEYTTMNYYIEDNELFDLITDTDHQGIDEKMFDLIYDELKKQIKDKFPVEFQLHIKYKPKWVYHSSYAYEICVTFYQHEECPLSKLKNKILKFFKRTKEEK